MIDWNKPIRVVGDHRKVHVIANPYIERPGAEPTVLIQLLDITTEGKRAFTSGEPLRRYPDGSHHPSNGSRGSAVKLENVPERRTYTVRLAPNVHGNVCSFSPEAYSWNLSYSSPPNIMLTFEGDRLLEAKVIDNVG